MPDEVIKEWRERREVVRIAHEWIGTPYRHSGRIKGKNGGADCLTLLAEIFAEAGLIEKPQIPYYPQDWHLHRAEERYMRGLLQYAHEIEAHPQPGDIVLWKFGRCYSHGAIVVEWPIVIHAYLGRACTLEDASRATWLTHIGENTADKGKPREKKFFSFWE